MTVTLWTSPCAGRSPFSGSAFVHEGALFYQMILPMGSFNFDGQRRRICIMDKHRIYAMSFASVYPLYIAKAKKKGRTKAEVDEIIYWLTGYSQEDLEDQLRRQVDFETFFTKAPRPNPARASIKGTICGVRVEDIKQPVMREIRYLDKLIDELAKGRSMAKILREV
jgi:hypothetical protein